MKKMSNLKQRIVAILMSVMCLTMIVPTGLTAIAAPEDASYTVTLSDCDGGTVTFDGEEGDTAVFAEGDEVALNVTPDDGYEFSGITLTLTETGEVAAEDTDVDETVGYTFTMPAADVTVTADFDAAETAEDAEDGTFPSEGIATLNAGIMELSTYDNPMIHEIEDNGKYPDSIRYFRFDDPEREHESDFSYETSEDVTAEEDMFKSSVSSSKFDMGFSMHFIFPMGF